nr:TetR family transcriptional regulator [Gluconacetobacter sacchari]
MPVPPLVSSPRASVSAPSRREARRRQTHAALIDSAMRLLSTRGFDATTVDEIAASAGISRRTLFRYFPTKADIVTAWAQNMTDVLTASVESCPETFGPREIIRTALEAVVPEMAENRAEAFAFVYLIERTPALLSVSLRKYARWEEALAAALASRLPRSPDQALAARVAARSAIAAFRTALDEWIRLKGRPALVPILRKVLVLQADLLALPA